MAMIATTCSVGVRYEVTNFLFCELFRGVKQ
jgi:hypothetical protein